MNWLRYLIRQYLKYLLFDLIHLNKNSYSGYVYADNATDNYYYTVRQVGRGAPGNPRVIGAQLGVDF
jgi:hypothetical protein